MAVQGEPTGRARRAHRENRQLRDPPTKSTVPVSSRQVPPVLSTTVPTTRHPPNDADSHFANRNRHRILKVKRGSFSRTGRRLTTDDSATDHVCHMSALLALVWRQRRTNETTATATTTSIAGQVEVKVEAAEADTKHSNIMPVKKRDGSGIVGRCSTNHRATNAEPCDPSDAAFHTMESSSSSSSSLPIRALPLPFPLQLQPPTVGSGLPDEYASPQPLLSSIWTMSSHGSSESDSEPYRTTHATASIVVVTPEGLKPRRSMQELREELLWMTSITGSTGSTHYSIRDSKGGYRDTSTVTDETARATTDREEMPRPVSPCRTTAPTACATTGTAGSVPCFDVTRPTGNQLASISSTVMVLASPVKTTTARTVVSTMGSIESNSNRTISCAPPIFAAAPMGRSIRLEDHHRCWHADDDVTPRWSHDASLHLHNQGVINSIIPTSGLGVLPPIPSRSWSTTGENNSNHQTLESTTSAWSFSPTSTKATENPSLQHSLQRRQSRVSWSLDVNSSSDGTCTAGNSTPVAESPNLIPGQARTAVGQLVGAATATKTITDDENQQLVSTPSYHHRRHHRSNNNGNTPNHSDDWNISPPEQSVESMYSPMLSASSKGSTRPTLPLYTYGGHQTQPQSPYTTTSTLTMTPRLRSADDENYCAPLKSSSVHTKAASIISSAASTRSLSSNNSNRLPMASPIQSTLKQGELIQSSQPVHTSSQTMQHEAGYRWVVTTTTSSHSSTSTSSDSHKSHHGSSPFGALKRTIQEVPPHHSHSEQRIGNKERLFSPFRSSHESGRTSGTGTSSDKVVTHLEALAYQRSKLRNQHRTKEELIMAALERLQDDIPLVHQVERLLLGRMDDPTDTNRVNSMFDWYVPTPMDQEGILIGFSETKRYLLLERFDALLAIEGCGSAEQNSVPHSSFNNNEHQVSSRDDLCHALSFCKVLVQMAIPANEKEDDGALQGTDELGRWNFLPELRPAIGLVSSTGQTATPPARGGDTSFFSLPHDDDDQYESTPMTSNVSVGASTLTTAVYAPRHFESSAAQRHERALEQNGLCLRQAIQLLCTGLQMLTLTCLPLLKTNGRLQQPKTVTDRIQGAYGKLLATMSYSDLKSIVDAFEFEQDMEDESYSLVHVVDSTDEKNDEKKRTEPIVIPTGSPSLHSASIVHDSSEYLDALPPRHTVVIDYADSEIDRRSERDGSKEDFDPKDDSSRSSLTGLHRAVTYKLNEGRELMSQSPPSLVVRSKTNHMSVANSAATRLHPPLDTDSAFRGCVSLDGRQRTGTTDNDSVVSLRTQNSVRSVWNIPRERVEL